MTTSAAPTDNTTASVRVAGCYCEISGDPIPLGGSNGGDAVVATPSGHVCYRRLLVEKLRENGGYDPFTEDSGVGVGGGERIPLSEGDLIPLLAFNGGDDIGGGTPSGKSYRYVPPRTGGAGNNKGGDGRDDGGVGPPSSMTSLLRRVRNEYDAALLELFDARKALEETRRELSQSLYQNDASIRVIARLSQERDEYKRRLLTSAGSVSGGGVAGVEVEPATKKRKVQEQQQQQQQVDGDDAGMEGTDTDKNKIPESDVSEMTSTWEELHKSRKSRQKEASSRAPTKEMLSGADTTFRKLPPGKNDGDGDGGAFPKNTGGGSGVAAMTISRSQRRNWMATVSAGDGGDLTVCDYVRGDVVCRLKNDDGDEQHPRAMDMIVFDDDDDDGDNNATAACVAVGSKGGGSVELYSVLTRDNDNEKYEMKRIYTVDASDGQGEGVVDVRFHPDRKHVVAATTRGRIVLYRLHAMEKNSRDDDDNKRRRLEEIASFRSGGTASSSAAASSTCGTLHPDGLIYLLGWDDGSVQVWDFKNQSLASTLRPSSQNDDDENTDAAVAETTFSNNGYHIASCHRDGSIRIWDLRKQSLVATIVAADAAPTTTKTAAAATPRASFDESGKFLAYYAPGNSTGGDDGDIRVVAAKEWDSVLTTIPTGGQGGDDKKDAASVVVVDGMIWKTFSSSSTTEETALSSLATSFSSFIVTHGIQQGTPSFYGIPKKS